MKMSDKRNVMLCVPCVNGWVRAKIATLVAEATVLSFTADYPFCFSWLPMPGIRPVELARNLCVGKFLEAKGCEWLWFIDNDMDPPDDWHRVLEEADNADIVTAPMVAYDLTPIEGLRLKMLAYRKEGPYDLRCSPSFQGEEVDAAGTGCLLINRRVFEHPAMKLPHSYTDRHGRVRSLDAKEDTQHPYWAPAYFRSLRKPNGATLDGEDIDFCLRARDYGFKIKCFEGNLWSQVEDLPLAAVLQALEHSARSAKQ